jgi:predicted RNase H-like HicB family nuclease
MKLTALIEREGDGHVFLCPELDIASQGDTIESARDNLREALELFSRPLRRKKSSNGSMRRFLSGLRYFEKRRVLKKLSSR